MTNLATVRYAIRQLILHMKKQEGLVVASYHCIIVCVRSVVGKALDGW